MKIQLTTTFKQLHDARACKDRYHHLARALGGIGKYGRTKPINLLTILEHNGLGDFFFVLKDVVEGGQVVNRIVAKGRSWRTDDFWDMEDATIKAERVKSIKRYLK